MKKIIFALIPVIIIISCPAVMANIYFDGYSGYVIAGGAGSQFGYGGNIGVGIHENFNLVFTGIYSSSASGNEFNQKKYKHMMFMTGIDYLLPKYVIPFFERNHIFLKVASIHAGYSQSKGSSRSGRGLCIAFKPGVVYDITQHFSIFFDLGYHISLYQSNGSTSAFGGGSVQGLLIMAGVRFSIYNNKTISENY